jgi:hypothetical protein
MRTGNAQTGATEDCPDNTGDGIINVADILNLLSKFGSVDDRVDVNKDGAVNVEDLLKVLGRFGSTCVPAPVSSVCADGLLLGVSFLNEAEDFSGNGGVVTYISAAGKRTIVSVPGTVIPEIGSTGVHFDGDGDYLTVKEGTDSYELDGMFSVSFWFTKEACTGGIYEYMFSHHERVDAAMWDFPYLDIYLGCESAGGGGSTLGGSVIRYWMRDTDGTEAMVGAQCATAFAQSALTTCHAECRSTGHWLTPEISTISLGAHAGPPNLYPSKLVTTALRDLTCVLLISTWVDISLVVIPSSIFLFEDGERVPDLQYGFYGSLAEADNAADPLPSSLSTPFAAGGRQTNIFDFGIGACERHLFRSLQLCVLSCASESTLPSARHTHRGSRRPQQPAALFRPHCAAEDLQRAAVGLAGALPLLLRRGRRQRRVAGGRGLWLRW